MRITNPRWRTTAILKNLKIAIPVHQTDFDEIWHDDAFWLSGHYRPLKFPDFQNSTWTAAILKVEKSPLLVN